MATTPRALHGCIDHTYVLELHGPMRYVVARALRNAADEQLAREDIDRIVIDLRGVDFIDSTALGLLARIGRRALERYGVSAVLVCPRDGITKSLHAVAFDDLFTLVEQAPVERPPDLRELPLEDASSTASDRALGRVVLDAHRDLAAVSSQNREAFRDVIAELEAELRRKGGS